MEWSRTRERQPFLPTTEVGGFQAAISVTWDNDLLDLMQDATFRAQYPRLTILNPVALLQILRPPAQPQP